MAPESLLSAMKLPSVVLLDSKKESCSVPLVGFITRPPIQLPKIESLSASSPCVRPTFCILDV